MRASSDFHLTPTTAPLVWLALAQLRADAEEHGGPTILCGDVLDQPKSVDMPVWNRLRRELRAFPGEVIVIPGNHDQYHGWESALEGLDGGNVRVITEPSWTDYGLMVPHTGRASWTEIVAGMGEPPGVQPRLTFAHEGFRGAYQNAMTRDTQGIPVATGRGVVVTGHYHMPQNCGPVVYCGSPYQQSFAEEGQRKSFLVWRDSANPVPARVVYDIGAPRYWTVSWDGDGKPVRPKEAGDNDRFRVVTTMDRDDVKKHGKALKSAGLAGASIVAQPRAVASGRGVVQRDSGPWQAVDEYIDGVIGADPTRPHPEAVREFARERGLWQP